MKHLRRGSGFTLVEVLAVMAILAIGCSVAVFSSNSLIPNLRLKAAVSNLKSDMHTARLTAVRQNTFVVSEFSTDGSRYRIYIDDGGGENSQANNYSWDAGEKIVKSVRLHPRINIKRAQFGSVKGKFAFNSRGSVDGLAGGIYLHNTVKTWRGVTISRIGKITVKVAGAF